MFIQTIKINSTFDKNVESRTISLSVWGFYSVRTVIKAVDPNYDEFNTTLMVGSNILDNWDHILTPFVGHLDLYTDLLLDCFKFDEMLFPLVLDHRRDTVFHIKNRIGSQINVNPLDFKLLLDGREQTSGKVDFCDKKIDVEFRQTPVDYIFLEYNNTEITMIELYPHLTLGDLKINLGRNFKFEHNGRVLSDDSCSLGDYGVQHGECVFLNDNI